jgi:hypothetical protein
MNIFEIEKKQDTAERLAAVAGLPTNNVLFAPEFNKVAGSYFGVFTDELCVLRFVSRTGTVKYINVNNEILVDDDIEVRNRIYIKLLAWIKLKNDENNGELLWRLIPIMREVIHNFVNQSYPNECNCSEVILGYLLSTAKYCCPELIQEPVPFPYEYDGSYLRLLDDGIDPYSITQYGMYYYLIYAAYLYRTLGTDYSDYRMRANDGNREGAINFIAEQLIFIKTRID